MVKVKLKVKYYFITLLDSCVCVYFFEFVLITNLSVVDCFHCQVV